MVLPATITSFTSNVSLILLGQSVTLSWSTTGAISPTINGAAVSPSGSKVYTPSVTTTYTLLAYSEAGGQSRSLTVTVYSETPPPPAPPPSTYNLVITTNPGSCDVTISGVGTFKSASSGPTTIGGIPAGSHDITVSKLGYVETTITRNFTTNLTLTVSIAASPVICTPGALKCIGVDLYVCNTAGTAWTLKTANSPTCQASAAVPDFWTDPVGWVVGVITNAWSGFTGFVMSQFKILQSNINNFTANFMAQLVAFIQDPITKLKSWLGGVYATISSIAGQVTSGITSWWTSTTQTIMGWINSAVKSANEWISSFSKTIADWWSSTVKTITSWVSSAWASINEFTVWIVSNLWGWLNSAWKSLTDFTSWISLQVQGVINTTVAGIKTWVEGFVLSFSEALASEFFTGFDRGINTAHHSPFDAEQDTDNEILKGLQRYMKKYRDDRENKKV